MTLHLWRPSQASVECLASNTLNREEKRRQAAALQTNLGMAGGLKAVPLGSKATQIHGSKS